MNWVILISLLLVLVCTTRASKSARRWVLGILIGLDQLVNAFLGGNPDETISSAVGRRARKGRLMWLLAECLIDGLFWLLTGRGGHCRASIEWDELNTWR